MIVTLLILNVLCGVWNSILATSDSQISAFVAPVNWIAVGILAASLIKG
ncbi:hypothetical protein Hena1_00080 [Erwinia phage Hena1]|uniref:Uncharacterized protein n=1 Tax=Erwinia phage Hena1 TaxID=2678601 RepID=A0A6B9J7Z7_9CAUD|nr:hypothetical protein HWC84_gp007 [Erwinia phage Hena1]QGZ16184.1 hypothetical protein Hena1_00080 [Erwinia phage Hena1]